MDKKGTASHIMPGCAERNAFEGPHVGMYSCVFMGECSGEELRILNMSRVPSTMLTSETLRCEAATSACLRVHGQSCMVFWTSR